MPAELRMNQLMAKLGEPANVSGPESSESSNNSSAVDPKNFKAMVTLMQSQMMGEALVNPNDKDSQNPMSSLMGAQMGGMGMNPMMMGQMGGQMNPAMLQAMMMQGGGSGMMDPMTSMMMGMNPMMMQSGIMNNLQKAFPNQQQEMIFPLKGTVSSEYGHREHPISGHNHFHTGVDIAAAKGSPIRMPYDGTVVHVGHVAGFGDNTVIVAHENQVQPDGKILYSVFGHNEHAFVQKGERVQAGDIFATVGSEGNSTGPHLHWETRIAPVGVTGTRIFEQNLSYTVNPLTLA